jgi:hypothetical protein
VADGIQTDIHQKNTQKQNKKLASNKDNKQFMGSSDGGPIFICKRFYDTIIPA